MALTSPGVEVTVIDESQYIPAATNSVPYILIATAQNKVSGAGVGVAAGTLAANANRPYLISSQRDLSATFGVPFFYKTTNGTPINGYELNEYGLLAAYSALGITNRAYVQRVDIDLAELTASLVRPTGAPDNGTYWLDTATTTWGINQWNLVVNNGQGAFTSKIPTVITNTTDLEPNSTVPLQSIGAIGDYAVTATNINNPVYYKRSGPSDNTTTNSTYLINLYNTWVLVGSDDWKTSWSTVQGTITSPVLTAGTSFSVNGITIEVPASPDNTVGGVSDVINNASISGVYSSYELNRLTIYADSDATADGSTLDGQGAVSLSNVSGTPLAQLGITAQTYYAPAFLPGYSYNEPRWSSSQDQPAPTGSVWQKLNNVNAGSNLVIKRYNTTLGAFVQQSCPIFANSQQALFELDPVGGGKNIPAGTLYARFNPSINSPETAGYAIFDRYATGPAIYTGNTNTPGPFVVGNTFTLNATVPGLADFPTTPVTVTLTGTTAAEFVTAVSAAVGQPGSQISAYVSASINSAGALVFTHSAGGNLLLQNTTVGGNPLTTAGFDGTTEFERLGPNNGLFFSYFVGTPLFTYTASNTAPDQDPDNGAYWYYSATTQADIMIQDNGTWQGYKNVSNDVRGFNLTQTNATGPIFSTTAPATQNNASESPLVYGDLWIDTSDLENYPKLSRWSTVEGVDQWVLLDNTDQVTQNGILFADARWASNGTTNPITDNIPSITTLLTSNYLDLDAPEPTLYPQGTLLFNTRRSGFNVKSFEVDYFSPADFNIDAWSSTTVYEFNDFVNYNGLIYVCILAPTSNQAPTNTAYWAAIETNTWITASANKNDGSPNMGRLAQRYLIVQALKAGIDANVDIREEQRQFNLIACPQYPELIPNMVELNNNRRNTAFVIGDTPLRLGPTGSTITDWKNNAGTSSATGDGLATGDVYLGVFYPSCQTTDLSGSPVVQPPSHMMIRTIIRSDEVAFPWLAPAGTRRGVIDNAARLGYVNGTTGEFETIGVSQGLRDVLYQEDINPITFVPGIGITNFGNKTTTSADTALDRINVARLVAFIRGRLQEIGDNFLFEPNDQITRNEIKNTIDSLMIDLVNKRGIYDYLVVCDLTNNTPARIDRNELYVDIAIEPVKAVEFIYIPLRIRNTGEIATSLAVTAQSA
jgi:hypothetical protein